MPVTLPCGKCIGCRLERSRQWAIRIMHENSLHIDSQFITLTYDEGHLPRDGGLDKTHFRNFIKRYRQYLNRKENGQQIRYFHCGEYGDPKNTNRPHYHAIIFGHDFPDKVVHHESRNEDTLYSSNILTDLWTYGHCLIGNVTFESAAYVARYIMKKVYTSEQTPDKYDYNYERVDPDTGECFQVEKEYTTMSRRPGIGKAWFDKYGKEVFPVDNVVLKGIKMQPPKYYEQFYPDMEIIKKKRKRAADKRMDDNTLDRLMVKENCKLAQIKNLKRNLRED